MRLFIILSFWAAGVSLGVLTNVSPMETSVKFITTISCAAKARALMLNSRVPKAAYLGSRDLRRPVMKKISKEYGDMLHRLAAKSDCLKMSVKLENQAILRKRSLPSISSAATEDKFNFISDCIKVFTNSDEFGNVYIEGFIEDGYCYELRDEIHLTDFETVTSEDAHSLSWSLLDDVLEVPAPREEGLEQYKQSLAALDDQFEILEGSRPPSRSSLDEPFEIPEPTREELQQADRLRNS